MEPMQKAAKEKSFILWIVASVALFCVPSFASSVHDLPAENRVEIFLLEGQNGVEPSTLSPAIAPSYYDSASEAASESSVAPNRVAPDVRTGAGYGVNDPPVRIQGEWTDADFRAALNGSPPPSLGRPDLHHAGQMPGSAIHEVIPGQHRGNPALHPNKHNQGVTNQMRAQDRQLHWWYRAREAGADQLYPDNIYKK